ncbi:O-antigen ligase family protein [Marinospirillum minutulum]|uniref:O-antigen ligase family protein n=1 Tax=Marinospirillum minutulum TaxID=64974 RepID=UPI00042595E8|nr:O-antigen ligase family protein [Marinospirillum minutulum]
MIINNALTVFIFLFFALITVFKISVALGYFSFLAAIILLLLNKGNNFDLSAKDKVFSKLWFVVGSLWCLIVFFDNFDFSDIDKPVRIVFISLALLALLKFNLNKHLVIWGVSLGAVLSFIIAFYGKYILGLGRPTSDFLHPIIFGDFSMALGLMSICLAYFYKERARYFYYFILIAGALGVFSSFLSGSRGGWIGLPFISFYMFVSLNPDINKLELLKKTLLVFIISIIAVIAIPNSGVYERALHAVSDVDQYFNNDNKATSVGARLEMWKFSILTFKEAPLLGVGAENILNNKEKLVEDEIIDSIVLHFSHSHNDYMDSLAERGLLGFILLIFLYLIPILLFRSLNNGFFNPFAISGCVISFCFIDFSLTESLLTKNIGISFYLISVTIMYVLANQYQRGRCIG